MLILYFFSICVCYHTTVPDYRLILMAAIVILRSACLLLSDFLFLANTLLYFLDYFILYTKSCLLFSLLLHTILPTKQWRFPLMASKTSKEIKNWGKTSCVGWNNRKSCISDFFQILKNIWEKRKCFNNFIPLNKILKSSNMLFIKNTSLEIWVSFDLFCMNNFELIWESVVSIAFLQLLFWFKRERKTIV